MSHKASNPPSGDILSPFPDGLHHVGIIPDGNRTWAKREGVSLGIAYHKASENLGWCLRQLFSLPNLQTVTVYLLSANNLARGKEELEVFSRAGIFFAQHILPPILAEHQVALCLVWIDSFEQRIKKKVNPRLRRTFVETYSALATKPIAPQQRCLYALLAYDPFEELRRTSHLINDNRVLSIRDLSVPVALDLVIRTGRNARLSSFLPLQAAEAELAFMRKGFPDLKPCDVRRITQRFCKAKRKFGR